MYHHRYQPPPHLATNKTNSAYASNNNHALNSYPSSSSSTSIAGAAVVVSPPNSSRPFVTKSTRNNNNNNGLYLGLSKHYIAERQDVIFRKVRGILNKITPETFDKLSKELVNVGLDSPRTLRGVIYLLFDKALKDLKYSSLYAKLCQELSEKAPNFEQEPGPNTFCKFLISKCEDEFERRRKASEDFENKNELTDEEYEQKAIVKQKMLGNIKFICELGKKRLLQEEILHECIRGLLSKKKERPIQDQAQDLECLCQIMRTIGSLLDVQASRNLMNQYFERIDLFSKKPELPPRIRFMLRDCIDLRNNNWRPRPFQREDNVPQPLSKLREEAGYDQHSNSTIDKYGNNSGGFLGMGDTSKSSENKLSALLHQHHYDDDEPSFTTSTDFHWGPTFLDQPTFDPFSSNSRHMTNHNLKQQQQQPQQQHQQHRLAPQKQPLTRQQHPQPPPPQQQQQPPQQHRQAPQKQPFMRMQQQQQFQPQPQQQQQQPQQHRQAPQKQPFVRLQQQQHQPQQQQPQQHQPPPHIVQTLNPLLPKPPTKLSDTNFSLRPSHNLAGRVHSSGPSSNGQQSSTFNKQNQPNLDSIGKENHHQDQNFKPVTRFQERAQALPPPSTLPPVSLGNHGTSSEGSKVVASSGPASDFYTNKFISALTECFNESAMNTNITRVAAKVKELKIPKEYQHECLVRAMKEAILKGEKDRENIGKLFNQLIPSSFESPALMNAFKIIFEQMHSLEVETPKVKSLVAGFLSQATLDGLSTLEEVGKVLSGGKHHPLFLLYLQKLEKSAGQAWLNEKFVASKINLMDMLPEADKSKDRLASVLKDRCLGFLDPMLTIEPDLWEQMKEKDSSPASIYRWIKDNVDQSIQNTPTFAHVLISCLLRYVHNLAKASLEQKDGDSGVAEQSSNKSSPSSSTLQSIGDIEKEILAKYQQVLQATLKDKRMQLATLYALQSFYHKLDFPKGSLLRWFHMLYDMNIVDDDVFFVWKEEINDEIPGKGQALFQVNTWLNWLAEAESEEEDDDEENA